MWAVVSKVHPERKYTKAAGFILMYNSLSVVVSLSFYSNIYILISTFYILSSLSKLSQLRVLNLNDNNFSGGLPSVIEELTRLEELFLWKCKIRYLPAG